MSSKLLVVQVGSSIYSDSLLQAWLLSSTVSPIIMKSRFFAMASGRSQTIAATVSGRNRARTSGFDLAKIFQPFFKSGI
ncbi:hypothetical protein AVDCRST_MAG81-1449 [uncultured Synechococcales cyanobacterium]|uniref:Uncharacterized protein n=1 Tax=uncultured Synechococcales cyanobacterium TaxID=1936017 RepID=A0A6J4V4X6_9CYAN|nr:hypothetical protein AVDCRST_MAG81-1449 [uncultured Synechococcales cyanobacterium]